MYGSIMDWDRWMYGKIYGWSIEWWMNGFQFFRFWMVHERISVLSLDKLLGNCVSDFEIFLSLLYVR